MPPRPYQHNDDAITVTDRLFNWSQGRHPDDHPGQTELGFSQYVKVKAYVQTIR